MNRYRHWAWALRSYAITSLFYLALFTGVISPETTGPALLLWVSSAIAWIIAGELDPL